LLSLIGAVLCWGMVPPMLKYLARPEFVPDGFTANAIRYPIAALFWLPWLVWGLGNGQVKALWRVALIPSAVNIAGQTFWAISPYYLDASLAAFLFQISSVFSILAAFVVFSDERPLARDGQFWVGTVLAVCGFVLLSVPSLSSSTGGTPVGILVISQCGLFMAFYGVSVRYVLGNRHPLVLFSLVAAYTSIGCLVMAPLGQPAALLRLSGPILGLVIVSALVGIAFAHGFFYITVQRLGVALSYLVLMTTPLISFAVSAVTLGERFSTVQWLGGITLLVGSTSAVHAHNRLRARVRPAEVGPSPERLPGEVPPEPG